MKKVADILKRKGKEIISVTPQTTVLDALRLMADRNIGSVLVTENNEYKGLMSERDYSRKIVLKGKSSTDTLVADIMTSDLPTVHPNDSIEQCMQLLSDKHIRYLPVFEDGKLTGIISINDVVKEIMLSQEEIISNLKDYLHANA
ncbi:CBS domain-containing protein [Flavisolibacter ginsenosidimutans]|uniref:CBS domain-containing protein n=1 Tax=Flavisolibacter ginsenosidimutans TaxID=661481 RepID=A0A5B8UFT4_9BACT|nr:CBS domain-containing protein [Flavisolibacter ginsenosidimutans]QEC55343.1 CBS domain-containing protein [Flavisolibacter ginsenosidimutans]